MEQALRIRPDFYRRGRSIRICLPILSGAARRFGAVRAPAPGLSGRTGPLLGELEYTGFRWVDTNAASRPLIDARWQ
jgi:hypothetical protein